MSILNLPQTIEAVLIAFSSTIVSYYSTTIHCILFIARAIRRTIVITEYPISFTHLHHSKTVHRNATLLQNLSEIYQCAMSPQIISKSN